jgi:Family of unknown function (DUF5906)
MTNVVSMNARKKSKLDTLHDKIQMLGFAEPEDYAAAFTENRGPDMPGFENGNLDALLSHWVWVAGVKRFLHRPDGTMWDMQQFDSKYTPLIMGSASISKSLFKSNQRPDFLRLNDLVFRPGRPEIEEGAYNRWRQPAITPVKGDTTVWNEHIKWLLQDETEREHVLDWLAWVYQNQNLKPNYALLFVGKIQGTGKSWVARVMERLLGRENTKRPKNTSLKGDFNGWASQCKLCIIEELMQIGRREVANDLRDIITEPYIEVNIKNVPAFEVENYIAIIAISNNSDALPLDDGDRRWYVVNVKRSQEDKDARAASDFYKTLFAVLEDPAALAAIAYDFSTGN